MIDGRMKNVQEHRDMNFPVGKQITPSSLFPDIARIPILSMLMVCN